MVNNSSGFLRHSNLLSCITLSGPDELCFPVVILLLNRVSVDLSIELLYGGYSVFTSFFFSFLLLFFLGGGGDLCLQSLQECTLGDKILQLQLFVAATASNTK